jgi:hypothetical protein
MTANAFSRGGWYGDKGGFFVNHESSMKIFSSYK